ncbi:BrnT family toxin [Pusillimonas sp.]|uniref:BrnT family toxin n=1 Tax=Pusillimonas sp. TaxID=3040095 RepID=UPI0037C9B37C
MDITYDSVKNSKNLTERGLSFDAIKQFDFSTAVIYPDIRKDYGETRYVGVGRIKERLHVVVFTETETGLRVISLRKANRREINAYAKHHQAPD